MDINTGRQVTEVHLEELHSKLYQISITIVPIQRVDLFLLFLFKILNLTVLSIISLSHLLWVAFSIIWIFIKVCCYPFIFSINAPLKHPLQTLFVSFYNFHDVSLLFLMSYITFSHYPSINMVN